MAGMNPASRGLVRSTWAPAFVIAWFAELTLATTSTGGSHGRSIAARNTLTLPGPRHGGLPGGIQIIAKPYAEATLFAIGQAYPRLVPPELAVRV